MIETAIAAFVVLTVMVCAIEVGRLNYYRIALKNAVSQAARYATTGQRMPDPNNPGQTLSREDSIVATIQKLSVGIPVTSAQVTMTATDDSGNVVNGGGEAGDVVTISVTYNVNVVAPVFRNFFTNHQYTFTASTTFLNEEFTS